MPAAFASTATFASAHPYPGRGLLVGTAPDGVSCAAYWLTGRSAASRLRRFRWSTNELVVEDTSDGPEDDLRHYTAAVANEAGLVVGNGTHVREVVSLLESGDGVEGAMRTVAFEPDPPIFTPRILAAGLIEDGAWRDLVISGASHDPRWPSLAVHRSLHLGRVAVGQGVGVTTYAGGVDQPDTSGVPNVVPLDVSSRELADAIWEGLPSEVRVGVVVLAASAEIEVLGLASV